jgi:hypothetical protein
MQNPNHPIWGLARLLIMMAALCFVLWLNASNFDATEVKSLAMMFVAGAGIESVSTFLGRKRE